MMKLSKKIVSIAIIMCMLLTSLSVFATTLPTPDVILTGLPLEPTTFEGIAFSTSGIDFAKTGAILEATKTAEGRALLQKYTVQATVPVGDKTIVINHKIANGENARMWIQNVITPSTDFAQAMIADTNCTSLIKDGTGAVDTSNTTNYKKNLVRYIDYLVNNNPASEVNYINLPDAEFTLVPPATGVTFEVDNSVPQGSFVLGAAKITNTLDSAYASFYEARQNSGLFRKTGNAVTVDGPYTLFTSPYTGEFQIWAHNTSGANRMIAIDVAGTEVTFTSSGTSNEMIKGSTTVSLTKGEKVYVRILNETNTWIQSWGFVFVPDSFTGTLASTVNNSVLWNNSVSGSAITFSSTPVSAVVNGNAVSATAGSAVSKFYNLKMTANGAVITTPTVLDAIIAADTADNTYALTADTLAGDGALTAGTFTDGKLTGYKVFVNGTVNENLDQTLLSANDTIVVKPADSILGDFPIGTKIIAMSDLDIGESGWFADPNNTDYTVYHKDASNLNDGPKQIFLADTTETYHVYGLRKAESGAATVCINNQNFTFSLNGNSASSYYWDDAINTNKTVDITAGEVFTVQLTAETELNADLAGIALVPTSEAEGFIANFGDFSTSDVFEKAVLEQISDLNIKAVSLNECIENYTDQGVEVSFYVTLADQIANGGLARMEFALSNNTQATDNGTETTDRNSTHVFSCNIPADNLCDRVTAKFFVGDELVFTKEYSIKTYAYFESDAELVNSISPFDTAAKTALHLSWTTAKYSGNKAIGYNVYQDGVLIGENLSEPTLLIENLTKNTAYTFKIVTCLDGAEANQSDEGAFIEKTFSTAKDATASVVQAGTTTATIEVSGIGTASEFTFAYNQVLVNGIAAEYTAEGNQITITNLVDGIKNVVIIKTTETHTATQRSVDNTYYIEVETAQNETVSYNQLTKYAMPIMYDTLPENGKWNVNASDGAGNGHLAGFLGADRWYSSGTPSATLNIPADGEYFLVTSGYNFDSNIRYINAKIDGVSVGNGYKFLVNKDSSTPVGGSYKGFSYYPIPVFFEAGETTITLSASGINRVDFFALVPVNAETAGADFASLTDEQKLQNVQSFVTNTFTSKQAILDWYNPTTVLINKSLTASVLGDNSFVLSWTPAVSLDTFLEAPTFDIYLDNQKVDSVSSAEVNKYTFEDVKSGKHTVKVVSKLYGAEESTATIDVYVSADSVTHTIATDADNNVTQVDVSVLNIGATPKKIGVLIATYLGNRMIAKEYAEMSVMGREELTLTPALTGEKLQLSQPLNPEKQQVKVFILDRDNGYMPY